MDVRKVGDGRGASRARAIKQTLATGSSRAAIRALLASALLIAAACGGHRGEGAGGAAEASSPKSVSSPKSTANAPPPAEALEPRPSSPPARPSSPPARPSDAAGPEHLAKPELADETELAAAPLPPPRSPSSSPPATAVADSRSPSSPSRAVAAASNEPSSSFPADCSATAPSQAQREILWATPDDREPEQLDGVNETKIGQHYYVSDEGHADRFREHIAGAGGGYVGIGSDQAYLYIGWARPQFAWTVDYDPHIVRLHRIQQAFLVAADSPAAYLALWQREQNAQARAIVETLATDRTERRSLLKVLSAAQPRIRKRMARLDRNLRGVPSYLSDQSTYDFVRNLVRNGCVRPMLVNLLDVDGLRGITKAATRVGLPIRTLYLSNAEEYWEYTDQFRANVRGLPRDARSMVLHTISSSENEDYIYIAQPLDNFVAWLDARWARRSRTMIGRVHVDGMTHFPSVRFEEDPAEALARRKAKRKTKRRSRQSEEPAQAVAPVRVEADDPPVKSPAGP